MEENTIVSSDPPNADPPNADPPKVDPPKAGPRVRLLIGVGVAVALAMMGAGVALGVGLAGDGAAGTGALSPTASAAAVKNAAFSQCMRQNGVTAYPDPAADGHIELGVGKIDRSSAAYKQALAACKSLEPANKTGVDQPQRGPISGGPPPSGVPQPIGVQNTAALRDYVSCMRRSGVPAFPDPNPSGMFDADPSDPKVSAANKSCAKYLPAGSGQGSD
jgi:hypothetical protein